MKNLVLVVMAVVFLPLMSLAQGGEIEPTFMGTFATLAGFALAIPLVTQFIKNLFKIEGGFLAQVLSWVISVFIAGVGFLFEWGIFAEIEWYIAAIYAVSGALVANGIFDLELVKTLLTALGLYTRKTRKVKKSRKK